MPEDAGAAVQGPYQDLLQSVQHPGGQAGPDVACLELGTMFVLCGTLTFLTLPSSLTRTTVWR